MIRIQQTVNSNTLKTFEVYVFYSVLFSLPFGISFHIPFLFLWIVIRFVKSIVNLQIQFNVKDIIPLVPPIFYMIHLLGVRDSPSLESILPFFETKLSLILVPILYPWHEESYKTKRNQQLLSLVSGTIVSSVICLIISTLNSVSINNGEIVYSALSEDGWGNNFFTVYFSYFLHPTYLSLIVSFSIISIYCLRDSLVSKKRVSNILAFFIIVFLITIMFLLQSRAAFIAFALLVLLLILYWTIKRKKWIVGSIFIIVFFSTFLLLFEKGVRFNRTVFAVQRILETGQLLNDSNNESEIRLWEWDSSLEIIKENLLRGVGIANVQEQLDKKYLEKGVKKAYTNHYNAHNQFLQTTLEVGLPGLIFLIFLIAVPAIIALKNKDFLTFSFTFLFAFNLLFESMLVRISGISFFVLFYCILLSRFVKAAK